MTWLLHSYLYKKSTKIRGTSQKERNNKVAFRFSRTMEFFSGAMLLFVGFREGIFSYYSFWEERKIGRCWKCIVSKVILTSVEGWNVAVKDVLKWKKVWDRGGKNGEEWEAMMFWQLYWNCIKFWKPVICQLSILDSSSWAPWPFGILPSKTGSFARSDSLGRRADPPKPYEEWETRIIRSWFVVCGSMACHPGIIKLHYAIFFGGIKLDTSRC